MAVNASDKVLSPLYPHHKNIILYIYTYVYIIYLYVLCMYTYSHKHMYPHLQKSKVQVAQAVDKVQMLVLKTYSFIRSQVCDQATTMLVGRHGQVRWIHQ